MNIIGIKTNDGYYITDDLENKSYSNPSIGNYIINGHTTEKTFHSKWFKVKEEPTTVQSLQQQPAINKRFELKDSNLSDKFKHVWLESEARYYDGDDYEYSEGFIPALYEYKQDAQEPILVDVDFKYSTIQEIEEIKMPEKFSYKRSGQWDNSENYGFVTNTNLKYDMIAEIITPSILLHTQPCKLSKKESYDIIRKYIKENINGKVAEVTSDYDFCLTVKKKITLPKEHIYKVDVNDNFFGLLGKRKKKPKYETRIQKSNSVTIFECAPSAYQSYTVVDAFEADSQDGLKELIDNYLEHLISVINEPLLYCECCNGTGVKELTP